MTSARDFDALAMAVDLIRQEECERLFKAVYEHKAPDESRPVRTDYSDGYRDGLKFAMDILDARIGHLRDRWG